MIQPIVDFNKDELGDWRAELACGHFQHVRHKPPFINRPWVETVEGRNQMKGMTLNCIKCDQAAKKEVINH